MTRSVLVTGAAGFVGSNFLRATAALNRFDITAVYNRQQPRECLEGVRYLSADLTDLDECRRVTDGAEMVCMFAGRLSTTAIMASQPLGPVTDNTVMNTNMLDAAYAAGVSKYLWLSSTTGYPASDEPLREEQFYDNDPPAPYEVVGWMSRYVEKLAMYYATKTDPPMTTISLRPTSIYGPYDDFDFATCHALPAMIRRVVERHRPIEVWSSGEDGRDLLFVGDLVRACLMALDECEGYCAYNIGAGISHTLNEALQMLIELDSFEDAEIVRSNGRKGPVSTRSFDCSLAREALAFESQTVLREGLLATMDWFKRTNSSKGQTCH